MKSLWEQVAEALEAPYADAVHGELQWTDNDGSHLHSRAEDDGTVVWTILDRRGFVRSTHLLAPGLSDGDYT